ncbi:hypothetical protein [[Mycoplasma] testudinis]|uniref:hypothetical protein n=1 Tax=[Mycoplasma] testudinis TaxID=33924 RepID=UPI00056AA0EA|nr:hypothetical protein [[Mycoplasma] testudinis]
MNNDNKKTLKFKSSSKDLDRFERVKLEETKVMNVDGKLNVDSIHLEDLKMQLKSAKDKKVIADLKSEIKALEKKIAKSGK